MFLRFLKFLRFLMRIALNGGFKSGEQVTDFIDQVA